MFTSDSYIPGWQREVREKLAVKRVLFSNATYLPCHWCGVRLSFGPATLDHLITQSVGGNTSVDNIVLSCSNCNSKRRDRRVEIWAISPWLNKKKNHLEASRKKIEKLMAKNPQEVVMVLGFPASGKSSLSGDFIDKGYVHLNRDTEGGQVKSLVPKMDVALRQGKSVVLDNLFTKVDDRHAFIFAAKNLNVPVRCLWMQTSIEDAQINALNRMWDRYNQIFFSSTDIKNHPEAKKDDNIFPIAVLFKYRKDFEKPTLEEGFVSIEKVPFIRRKFEGNKKALILDYDGTLRLCKSGAHFPTDPKDVQVIPGRAEKLKEYQSKGYILLGVSNQSGIGKGTLTKDQAEACFKETNKQLGLDIPYFYSPASVPPVSTYCRKPQLGIAVYLIRRYMLNPQECIVIGDMTSDATFAARIGFQFIHADKFFV